MSEIIKLKESIENAVEKAKEALTSINTMIKALPDNPNITRLSSGAFVASSQYIFRSGNWTPEYHDFKVQYEAVAAELTRVPVTDIHKKFVTILNEGFVMRRATPIKVDCFGNTVAVGHAAYRVNLHPDVINHLKNLLN